MLKKLAISITVALSVAACDTMPIQMGAPSAKTTATGAAAGATAENANPELERCAKPLGTLALDEDQNAPWYWTLTNEYKLTSTRPVLRLLVQQSNCFVVVERSASGMEQMNRERALQQSGELRSNSNFGKGQMVSADYALSPNIVFSSGDTGGLAGALGGRIGGSLAGALGGSVGAALGGSLKFREASTILTLVDNRSSVQVAVSEGSSKKADMGLFGGLFGGSAGGALGGYTKTPEGKVIAAAFTDAYNQMVRAVKNYRPQDAAGPGGHGTGGALQVR